jgi:predicted nucleotide-binding protein (sugar kinase/HSP70/actin superfamily)
MKKDYTILNPMMLPVHFKLYVGVLRNAGYKFELLENSGAAIVQKGRSMCTTMPATLRYW